MTRPRQILPGQSMLLTRTCSERRKFLTPRPWVGQAMGYFLGVFSQEYGMDLHVCTTMSNHYHTALTDPYGNCPEFMRELNRELARCFNHRLGHQENFWAPGSYNRVILDGPEAILDRCAYVLTNPVKHGAVLSPQRWPGFISLPNMLDTELVFARPAGFFRAEGGPYPDEITLRFAPPPGFASHREFIEQLEELVNARTQTLVAQRRVEGQGFDGPRRVLCANPFERPSQPRPQRQAPARRFCCLDPERLRELREGLRSFIAAHRQALEQWRRGHRHTRFPPGTYAMRVLFGASCVAPAAWPSDGTPRPP